jgi:putative nucleotidyltransferase with HDIG domain
MTGVSKEDLKKGILRGHPEVSTDKMFSEDPLRLIRLIRIQAKNGFHIPVDVIKAVRRNSDRIKIVSAERIMEELEKIMKLGKLRQAVKFFKITGLLEHIFPEVNKLINVQQGKEHHAEGDVFKHTMKVLENAPATVEGQMSALLHDIGKPATQTLVENAIHFYAHEDIGGEIAEAMLRRLKFDGKSIDKIKKVVKNHMRPYDLAAAGEKAIRKFIRDVGDELVDSILELVKADELGSLPYDAKNSVYDDLKKRIEKIRSSPTKVMRKPILDGNEIMGLFKDKGKELAPGPKIKEIQNFLFELTDHYASQGKELTKEEARDKVTEHFIK